MVAIKHSKYSRGIYEYQSGMQPHSTNNDAKVNVVEKVKPDIKNRNVEVFYNIQILAGISGKTVSKG